MSRSWAVGRAPAACLTLFVACADASLSSQSLAAVADRESERRQRAPTGRVFTNADLAPVEPATAAVSPAVLATTAPAATAASTEESKSPAAGPDTPAAAPVVEGRQKRDERYWRAGASDLRRRLARANADAAGAESRLAEITAGAPTPDMARERRVVAEGLVRLRATARFLYEEMTRFQTRAGAENVPAEWTQ